MTQDVVTILSVDTREAVKSIADLRENIKYYKAEMEKAEVGSRQFQLAQKHLAENQNALKDAMYAGKASIEQLSAAAKGTAETYNGLVHQMAKYKGELRNIDVSTKEGKKQFQDLAGKIKGVNDRLKEMDALQGNYQRNVGNYKSALYGLADILKGLPPTLGSMREQAAKLGDTINMVGKQPILGLVGLLAPMIMKITESLKENETATNAIKKAMSALEPVFALVSKALETVAGWVAKAVDKFTDMAGESGETFKKIIAGAVGVGNTIIKFLVAPVKQAIEMWKGLGKIVKDIFSGDFKSIAADAESAGNAMIDAFKEGFSFKKNFELGQQVGEEFAQGLKSEKSKNAVKAAAKDLFLEYAQGVDAIVEENQRMVDAETDAAEQAYEKNLEFEQRRLDAHERFLERMKQADEDALQESLDMVTENVRKQLEAQEKAAEQRLAIMDMAAANTSSILGSIADMYESDQKNSEKNEKKIKNLRIAGSTIDTISGAISAFMSVWKSELPSTAKAILAPIQSASVLAAGMANIAKMKSVDASGNSTITSPAVASAPSINFDIPQIRSVTSQSEEQRLNQMASDQRVVLVMSDLEVREHQHRVQVAEATF